jgi:hypothetical protein
MPLCPLCSSELINQPKLNAFKLGLIDAHTAGADFAFPTTAGKNA